MSASNGSVQSAEHGKAHLQRLIRERKVELKGLRHQTIALHGSLLKHQERLISLEHNLGVLEGELKANHGVAITSRPEPIHKATAKSCKRNGEKKPEDPDFVHDLMVESGVMSLIEAGLAAEREMGMSAGEIEAGAETESGMVDVVAAAENGEHVAK